MKSFPLARSARRPLACSCAFALTVVSAQGQGNQLWRVDGSVAGARNGQTVLGVGNIDLVGTDEILTASPAANGVGEVLLFDSAGALTDTPIWTQTGMTNGGGFGTALATLGVDVGVTSAGTAIELIVGEPRSNAAGLVRSGSITLLDGDTGARIWTYSAPIPGTAFGSSVAVIPDINGDSIPDIAVGAPLDDFPQKCDAGSVTIISGKLGTVLAQILGDGAGDQFGTSLASGEVTGDGFIDLIVGAPFSDNGGTNAGSVSVYSGVGGVLVSQASGGAANVQLGFAVSTVDGNVLAGAPFDDTNGIDAGSVAMFDGLSGARIWRRVGVTSGDQLGFSVSGGGDFNADGQDDVLAGSPGDDQGGNATGSVLVFAANDGSQFGLYIGNGVTDRFGHSVSAAGDLDGDGIADFIVGANRNDNNLLVNSGSTYAFGGQPILAIELDLFLGRVLSDGTAMLFWSTVAEIDNAGFHLLREPALHALAAGPSSRAVAINRQIIPATGGQFEEAAYRWIDRTTSQPGRYMYWLQDVDNSGVSTYHGPIYLR